MLDSESNAMALPRPMPLSAVRCEAMPINERPIEPIPAIGQPLPAEAEFILSALEAAAPRRLENFNRRHSNRKPYHAVVHLRLFSDRPGAQPWVLYARDASMKSLGFVARDRLPLGYGGSAVLRAPDGQEIRADCVIQRCRETVSGWFEGALVFNRAQRGFEK